MDINTLIEDGKARIAKRKMEGEQESQARERAREEQAALELAKFKCEALGEFEGIQGVRVTDYPVILESTFEASVHLNAPLCEPVLAVFSLVRPYAGAPRGNCTWKLTGYHVGRVALDQIGEGVDEPWGVRVDMQDGFRTMFLDEALAMASAQCVERIILSNEALHMNEDNKAALAAQAKRDEARRDLQEAAFFPFAFYRVTYVVVVCEDGEMYCDTAHFDSLRERADATGYWMSVKGEQYRLEHVVKVERITVSAVEDMPVWCPTVDWTEWGTVRVPPKEAEKIEGA